MKKLTKRVQAGGLWFDVPSDAKWLTVGESGIVHAFDVSEKPFISKCLGRWHSENQRFRYECMIEIVDLDGEDWRECCWFVGDQVDGKDAERREWMTRGISSWIDSRQGRWNGTTKEAEHFSDRIRAGEVDL